MNKRTSKLLKKYAERINKRPRDVRRVWNSLTHKQRGQFRQGTYAYLSQ